MTDHELNVEAAKAIEWRWRDRPILLYGGGRIVTRDHPFVEFSPATSIEYAMGLLDTLQCDWIMMERSISIMDEGEFLPLPYTSNRVEYRGAAGRARAITEAFVAAMGVSDGGD